MGSTITPSKRKHRGQAIVVGALIAVTAITLLLAFAFIYLHGLHATQANYEQLRMDFLHKRDQELLDIVFVAGQPCLRNKGTIPVRIVRVWLGNGELRHVDVSLKPGQIVCGIDPTQIVELVTDRGNVITREQLIMASEPDVVQALLGTGQGGSEAGTASGQTSSSQASSSPGVIKLAPEPPAIEMASTDDITLISWVKLNTTFDLETVKEIVSNLKQHKEEELYVVQDVQIQPDYVDYNGVKCLVSDITLKLYCHRIHLHDCEYGYCWDEYYALFCNVDSMGSVSTWATQKVRLMVCEDGGVYAWVGRLTDEELPKLLYIGPETQRNIELVTAHVIRMLLENLYTEDEVNQYMRLVTHSMPRYKNAKIIIFTWSYNCRGIGRSCTSIKTETGSWDNNPLYSRLEVLEYGRLITASALALAIGHCQERYDAYYGCWLKGGVRMYVDSDKVIDFVAPGDNVYDAQAAVFKSYLTAGEHEIKVEHNMPGSNVAEGYAALVFVAVFVCS